MVDYSLPGCSAGEMEDSMESFFLSETSKYLYLLFKGSKAPTDFWVFTTEGHLFKPLPSPKQSVRSIAPHPECADLCAEPSSDDLDAQVWYYEASYYYMFM